MRSISNIRQVSYEKTVPDSPIFSQDGHLLLRWGMACHHHCSNQCNSRLSHVPPEWSLVMMSPAATPSESNSICQSTWGLHFRRQLYHTPDSHRNAKAQERSWRMLIFLTHLFGFFLTLLEFPGGRITMAFSEMPISRLYPKRLWVSGTTKKFRNLDYQQTPQVSWLWETLL